MARGCGSPGRSWTAPACPATARKTRGSGGWPCTTARTTSTSWPRWPGRTAAGPGWTTTFTGSARPCGISRRNTACRWWPGPTGRPRTGRPGPSRRRRPGRPGRAARVTLQRQVAAAAAGARSEPEFLAALDKRGVLVRLRHSTHNPGEVTGYAVGLPGDATASRRADLVRRRETSTGPQLAEAATPVARARRAGAPAAQRRRQRAAAAQRARDDLPVVPRSAAS